MVYKVRNEQSDAKIVKVALFNRGSCCPQEGKFPPPSDELEGDVHCLSVLFDNLAIGIIHPLFNFVNLVF